MSQTGGEVHEEAAEVKRTLIVCQPLHFPSKPLQGVKFYFFRVLTYHRTDSQSFSGVTRLVTILDDRGIWKCRKREGKFMRKRPK